MVSTIFLNNTKNNIIPKKFLEYLVMLENIKYLRNNDLISDDYYLKAKVQLKKSYISK